MRLPNSAGGKQKARAAKNLALRKRLWPDIESDALWNRQERVGFSTIPRAMPLLMSIMDDMSKGKPVGASYLEMWCRSYDEGYVILKHDDMAFNAGFSGERAVRTWKERLRILCDLGFIDLKDGPSGPASYALIYNPYQVVERHHKQGTPGLTEAGYNSMVHRMSEIGATDLDRDNAAEETEAELETA